MTYEITYTSSQGESSIFWTASNEEEARLQFERCPTYALCDLVRIDRIRQAWERE